jgi:hypothetical protein
MNLNLFSPNSSIDPILWAILTGAWLVAWLVGLFFLLSRRDLDPATKFMWVFVVVTIPVFGLIFYWSINTREPNPLKKESVAEGSPETSLPPKV